MDISLCGWNESAALIMFKDEIKISGTVKCMQAYKKLHVIKKIRKYIWGCGIK